MRTLRLKVKAESYPLLAAAAVAVNQVFNWVNATSIDAADRNRRANHRKGASRARHHADARHGKARLW
jgi:hypothetical protein